MQHMRQHERGMALAVAIFAIVVVGALVAGALFAGSQEQRVGESTRRLEQSFGTAEYGINDIIRQWNTTNYNSLNVYDPGVSATPDSFALSGTTLRGTGSYAAVVYKLNSQLYLITATGHDTVSGTSGFGGSRARQELGMIGRIDTPDFNVRGSLTSERGDVVKGNAAIDGFDQAPPGWGGCPALGAGVAGVETSKGDTVSSQGSATVVGNPAVKYDSTVADSSFSHFGSVTYTQLANMANVVVPGGTYSSVQPALNGSGQCDETQTTNWGDGANPGAPCSSYFPIIHVTGDLHLTGTEGQGILLVDGSLTITGSFQFFGITIIRGTLSAAGGGSTAAHFWGATMVEDSVVVGDNSISGHANINYSSCAILNALQATSVVAPMRARGWVQLF